MRKLLSLFLLLVLSLPVYSGDDVPWFFGVPFDPELDGLQVPIQRKNRLFNQTHSQCVWVTLESLGTHNGIEKLRGISRTHGGLANQGDVNYLCRSLGVRVVQNPMGYPNWDFIEEYVTKQKVGCGVGVGHGRVCHMITCVHFERGVRVKVIDNDGPRALQVTAWDWDEFRSRHNGWAFAVLP